MKSYFDELYELKVVPIIKQQAKQIDDDIRKCIKTELKLYGSIVKRYGDWAKFITKEICMVEIQKSSDNIFFSKALYYRGKYIQGYQIKIESGIHSNVHIRYCEPDVCKEDSPLYRDSVGGEEMGE